MPKVSAIIATYNRADCLAKAVDSIFTQNFRDFEVIIVNDGSTDNTEEILIPYKDRIKYIYQGNAGVAGARNRGLVEARGEYIAFLDSDDAWLPHRLQAGVNVLDLHPDIDLVFSRAVIMKDGEKFKAYFGGIPFWAMESKEKTFRYLFFFGHKIPTSSVLMRKKIFEAGYSFEKKYAIGEDYAFYLSLATFFKFFFYSEPLVLLTYSEKHLTSDIKKTQTLEKNVIKDSYVLYNKKMGLSSGDLRKSLSNSYTRDALKYFKLHCYGKCLVAFTRAFLYSCINLTLYSTILREIFNRNE